MPAKDFGDKLNNMFEFAQEHPIFLWKPIVERDFGQERFLIEDPTKLMQRGDFLKVPIMTGITEHEMVGAAVGN